MWRSHGTHDPTSAVVAYTRATQHSVTDGRGLRRFHSSLGCHCQGMVVVFLSGVATAKLLYSPINSFPPTLTQALDSVGHQKEKKKLHEHSTRTSWKNKELSKGTGESNAGDSSQDTLYTCMKL